MSFAQSVDCELTLELEETIEEGCGSSYVMTRTWTATDDCGNATTVSQTIHYHRHYSAPELTIPADYTAEVL